MTNAAAARISAIPPERDYLSTWNNRIFVSIQAPPLGRCTTAE